MQTVVGEREVVIPVDVTAVHRLLIRQHRLYPRVDSSSEQAGRVAWRVVRMLLISQLAMIAAGMATLDQLMLPYMRDGDGTQTMYEVFAAGPAPLELGR